jgi:GntR family transcriptional regulator
LLNLGVLEKQPGKGTFVPVRVDPLRTVVTADTGFAGLEDTVYASDVIAKRGRPNVTTPSVEIRAAPDDIADALGLDKGSTVVLRHQERFIDDILWSMQTTYYPRDFSKRADRLLEVKDIPEGVRIYLENALGIKEIGSRDKMLIRPPNASEAAAFKVPDDGRIAVFETQQIGIDTSGKPVRVTVSIYPAHRNQFSMETGDLAERPRLPEGK